ncbi:hypothetical protein QVD99_008040 [Batrachochytrium dendrobatidis]|nr:hypothetical protein O5D80_004806 [Batrachochytrium dendrobatidis]KAK5665194.1 hypothetical protein QVD99_008040 [Batrachochytrium dendrobatidis]
MQIKYSILREYSRMPSLPLHKRDVLLSNSTHADLASIPAIGTLGKLLLGAQLDLRTDSPVAANTRLGYNLAIIAMQQELPEIDPPSFEVVDQTLTNAAIMISIIPTISMSSIQLSQLESIAARCASFNARGRQVFLRFAPDFNAGWMIYGQQPTAFISVWNKLFSLLKSNSAFNTLMVWSPFEGSGYPFAGFKYSALPKTLDFSKLDTNSDGALTPSDDPYGPYWPGGNSVDWIGLSIFYKGANYPQIHNDIPPPNRLHDMFTGELVPGQVNFYQVYAEKLAKPMMISATATVYHVTANSLTPPPGGANEVDIKSAWWKQCTTNTTFLNQYPKLRAIVLEERVWNGHNAESVWKFDWRVLNNTLSAFKSDMHSVESSYEFATPLSAYVKTWQGVSGVPANRPPSNAVPIVPWDPKANAESGNSTSPAINFVQLGLVPLFCLAFISILIWCAIEYFSVRRRALNPSTSEESLPENALAFANNESGGEISSVKEAFDFDNVDDLDTIVDGRPGGPQSDPFDDNRSYISSSSFNQMRV